MGTGRKKPGAAAGRDSAGEHGGFRNRTVHRLQGFIPFVAELDDGLALDDADKHAAVIHNGYEVLIQGFFDEILHVGIDADRRR